MMSKPPSRRPPSGRPPARRSLVELTAAASRAAEEGPPVAPLAPATARDHTPARAHVVQTLDAETPAEREMTEAPLVLPEAAAEAMSHADHAARLDEPVAVGVGAAARYRAASLELVRASLETAIDHARGLIRARTLTECVELSSELARRQRELAARQAGALKSFARAAWSFDRRKGPSSGPATWMPGP